MDGWRFFRKNNSYSIPKWKKFTFQNSSRIVHILFNVVENGADAVFGFDKLDQGRKWHSGHILGGGYVNIFYR